MKEKIIFAPGASEKELLRSLSLNGINTFGVRILNMQGLSELAILKNGINYNKEKIKDVTKTFLIFNYIKNNSFFKNAFINDAKLIIDSIDELRKQIKSDENNEFLKLKNGEFTEKNKEILDIYNYYMNYLNNNNLYDEILKTRFVIENNLSFDAEFYTMDEFKLNSIEEELFNIVSKNKHDVYKIKTINKSKIKEYFKAYGQINEVENVFSYILKNNIKFDECTVAVTDTSIYHQIFKDYESLYKLPISYGLKTRIQNTNPGRLLKLLIDWINDNYSNKTFYELINSRFFNRKLFLESLNINEESFNETIDIIGSLRLSFDELSNINKIERLENLYKNNNSENKLIILEDVKKINNVFFKSPSSVFEYANIYNELDNGSKELIIDFLDKAYDYKIDFYQIINYIYNLEVGKKEVKEGHLYVTDINNAKSVLRKHLFVLGLSNNLYPGIPKENHIILDSDFELFNVKNKSVEKINDKINEFKNLIKMNENLNHNVYLSYSSFNVYELKDQSQSSLLLDTYINEVGGTQDEYNNKFKEILYFDSNISFNNNIGLEYLKGDTNIVGKNKEISIDNKNYLDFKKYNFSASSITNYFKCEFLFYLTKIIGLQEPYDLDSDSIIPANDLGTLIHKILEIKDPSKTNKLDFLQFANEEFNNYLIIHCPISKDIASEEYDKFISYVTNAYEMGQNDGETIIKEEDSTCIHESGLKIHGLPDKVVKLSDGSIRVIDYKIKNKIEHDKDNPDSIAQIIQYAYILNKTKGIKVSSCEFRYLKQKYSEIITDMDKALIDYTQGLYRIKDSIINNNFNANGDDEQCEYCYFKNMCPKYINSEDNDDEN